MVYEVYTHYLQSAYKPSYSTETALVKVQNDIFTSIDQHGIVILILLDLSAAFDTIDHDVLFSRMESTLGIIGPALEWFRSYLGDRTLRVQIDDSFSASQKSYGLYHKDQCWALCSS